MWIAAAILLAVAGALIPVRWLRLWREYGRGLVVANGMFLGLCFLLRPYFQSQSYVPLVALAVAGTLYLVAAWFSLNKRA
jgi:hypothetical protein